MSQPAPLTKEEYETQLKEAGNTVMKLAGMVSAHELKPEQTAATLIPFFNERLLKSNLIPILARVQAEGALRAKHRIPPGFSDVATSAEDGDVPNKGKAVKPSHCATRRRGGHQIYPTLNIWFFWPRRRGALALLFGNVSQDRKGLCRAIT